MKRECCFMKFKKKRFCAFSVISFFLTSPVTWFGHGGATHVTCLDHIPLLVFNWSEFIVFLLLTGCPTKVKEPNLSYYLSIAGGKIL